jgi:hypothetical protein
MVQGPAFFVGIPGPLSTLKMVQIAHAMRALAFLSFDQSRAGFAPPHTAA